MTNWMLHFNPRVVVRPEGDLRSLPEFTDIPFVVALENCPQSLVQSLPAFADLPLPLPLRTDGSPRVTAYIHLTSGHVDRIIHADLCESDPRLVAARAVNAFRTDRFLIHARNHTLAAGPRSLIMGIVNCTPDSFSDGGRFVDPDKAVARAGELARGGADMIDVGGLSTRPGAEEISVAEEIARVLPVVETLSEDFPVPVSIDTYRPEVAEAALEAGASIINDVTGLHARPELATLAGRYHATLVLMHMRGTPRTMQVDPTYEDLMAEVTRYLREAVETAREAGVPEHSIIIDPGFGFGKSVGHNLEILRRLWEFRSLGLPVMVGTSRKSTIGKVLDRPVGDRLLGTAATVAAARLAGALVFRVHDVIEMDQVRRMTDAILGT